MEDDSGRGSSANLGLIEMRISEYDGKQIVRNPKDS